MRQAGDEHQQETCPSDRAQGAARVPAQRQHRRDDGPPSPHLPHPTVDRRLRPARIGSARTQPRPSPVVHAGHPGARARNSRRVLGGWRATAGTLEPVLTTPIPREEFLLAKALAALVPSVVIAYAVYAFFVVCV